MHAGNSIGRANCWMLLAFQLGLAGIFFPAGNAGAQTLEAAQARFLQGDYAGVITNAQAQLGGNGYRADWRILLV